jgi:hypothetical protein
MPEWFHRLRTALDAQRVSPQWSVNPRLTLESFENVKLVPLEDPGDNDTFFLSASDLDDVLRNDADPT